MGTVRVNSVTIKSATNSVYNSPFYNNKKITSVDLGQVAWVNNSMQNAFYTCSNLISVSNFSQAITDVNQCFQGCSNLVSVQDFPWNSAANGNWHWVFSSCTKLTTFPQSIPNGVQRLHGTFYGCKQMVTAPIIPPSVTSLGYATDSWCCFAGCTNLTGNIYIESQDLTATEYCFSSTPLQKNIYIPFKYSNGTYTTTYDSFIASGYTTTGSYQNVYLKDIGTL